MLKHILIATALVGFSACSFRCDDEGPDKRAEIEMQTEKKEITVPDFDVHTEKREITVPDIDVNTEKREVTVPDIDVNKKRTTIEVPDIDVDGDEVEE